MISVFDVRNVEYYNRKCDFIVCFERQNIKRSLDRENNNRMYTTMNLALNKPPFSMLPFCYFTIDSSSFNEIPIYQPTYTHLLLMLIPISCGYNVVLTLVVINVTILVHSKDESFFNSGVYSIQLLS